MSGPYVNAAVFCEKVLQEKDNVMTLVRIYDVMKVQRSPQTVSLTMVIVFKSGDFVGEKTLSIRAAGRGAAREAAKLVFTGQENGSVVFSDIRIEAGSKSEVVWFEILLDEVVVTRVPLKVEVVEPLAEPKLKKQQSRRQRVARRN